MKKYFLIIIVLLVTTHLFAQEVFNKNRPKYGPFYRVEFEAPHTLVIDTFSIGMLDWLGNLLKTDTNFLKKHDVIIDIRTCPKEAGKSIGFERAKIVIDYLHYKYGIDRKHFPIRVGVIGYFNSFCNGSIVFGFYPAENECLTKIKITK